MPIASKKDSSKLKYVRLINQSVHTSDDIDIGDIFAVSKNIIVVVRGYINVHYYYIPIDKVEGWDGKVLWLNITEQQVKNYEKHDAYPDSSEYFVNDSPPYDKIPPDFPEPLHIPSKNRRPAPEAAAITTTKDPDMKYGCTLCEQLFRTQGELSNHVAETH
ncbi:hypothetical protein [Nitrososphaera sp. AFS]|uniref:hypothetical protein n=1 Tax=Nitrososphaera sp. AFS TaxID=2301191 RepID=UPI0013923743|nr:hypothetical protein [Nitrososphaera sp. AFS]NAL77570.1 hypothetical protein [Nitrososphaera sp. AFS]